MNLQDLIINDKEVVDLEDVLLSRGNKQRVLQLIKEHKYVEELHKYGLTVNNKILLHGNSGCGKTITAKAIANALKKNLITLNLSNVVSARIGETSQNIRMVFEKAGKEKAILFLDEFDQIGKARGNDEKDVGEMRRLVNSIIQLIDYYPKNALLISATNHVEVIDTALLRRFQLKMDFEMPSGDTLDKYYDKILSAFPNHLQSITRRYDVSFAEAKDYAHTVVKSMLIEELEKQEIVP
ncbi:AAA family ATPase [Dyadobacter sp. CY312]|uniref:AAA family ATPase n=1 Tax=Dyadobacter sp. CY312 TaxID=2907303 RepID=UPI001F2841C8|nr:ATP-binding protein [Dyadobacter sp. CY312]MCE7039102.1 ATP-binding protein [Dyadobacter sp. CY312]